MLNPGLSLWAILTVTDAIIMNIGTFKTRLLRYLNRRNGLILIYHSVVDVPLSFDMWTHIPLQLFSEHMAMLSREANVISLQEMAEGITRGKLPEYAVAVTFDDGYRNNFTRAYPVLKKYRIPATIFLSTGYMDRSELFWPEKIAYQLMLTKCRSLKTAAFGQLDLETNEARKAAFKRIRNVVKEGHPYRIQEKIAGLEESLGVAYREADPLFQEWLPLTWQDVKEMEKGGLVSFGGHTVSHAILTRLDDSEAWREIVGCRDALDRQLSRRSTFWAYPNGTRADFDGNHVEMLKSNFFQTILTAEPGHVTSRSDIGTLPRVGVGSKTKIPLPHIHG